MNKKDARTRLTRRDFLGTTAFAAGAAAIAPSISLGRSGSSILGANGSVGIGYIGIGIRGEILINRTKPIEGTRILGVADLYDGHFDRAKEILGSSIQTTKDYKQLLDNKEINAVVVAVPDHWHKQVALDAIAAGKDVYLEKPMTYRWEDGPVIAAAAKKAGRIVQVGSQHVNNPSNERALEIIKSGKLGKITMITGYNYRNSGTGAWYYPIPPDASPKTIDWKKFLGSAPQREFDPHRFFQWRLFWDYSGGLPTDLFVHLTTAVHHLMGVKMPSRVTALGSIHHWKNYREVPDLITGIAEYPEGFNFIMNATANNNHNTPMLSILGTEGTLDYYERRLVYYPEPMLEDFNYSTNSWPAETKKKYAEMNDIDPTSMRPNATAKMQRPKSEEISTPGLESTQAHLTKFVESVQTRKEPIENAEMGSQCATVGHMVNLSMKARKEAKWDAAKQKVVI